MAVSGRIHSVSYPAGADLSSNQFRAVVIDGSGQLQAVGNSSTPPVGVLLNKPSAAGRAGEVAIEGSEVKIEAIAALNEGDLVVASTGGRGSAGIAGGTAAGTAWVIGVCTQAASGSGAFGAVLVRPQYYAKA